MSAWPRAGLSDSVNVVGFGGLGTFTPSHAETDSHLCGLLLQARGAALNGLLEQRAEETVRLVGGWLHGNANILVRAVESRPERTGADGLANHVGKGHPTLLGELPNQIGLALRQPDSNGRRQRLIRRWELIHQHWLPIVFVLVAIELVGVHCRPVILFHGWLTSFIRCADFALPGSSSIQSGGATNAPHDSTAISL